jgi:hypothetical protein
MFRLCLVAGLGIGSWLIGSLGRARPVCAAEVAAPAQRLVHLMFADGQTAIPGGEACMGVTVPPAHHCAQPGTAADPEPCRQQIIGYLERWYGDFRIAFTTSAPSVPHDTVVITSGGDWCLAPRGLLGDAPITCEPLSGVAYVYACGDSAERCAALIAHEEGHLLGLEHVTSDRDLMSEGGCWSCAGFEDRDNEVVAPSACGRTLQNSHRWLAEQLGERPVEQAGGCDLGGGRPRPTPVVVLGLSLLLAAGARARRSRAAWIVRERPRAVRERARRERP